MTKLLQQVWRVLKHPQPYRATIAQRLWTRRHAPPSYPFYEHCVQQGARLARALGRPGITVVEFGVAGGNGLLALERYAQAAERDTGITIDVVGFDSGQGLPPPLDYRDMPYKWGAGYYPMDEPALRARLARARLVLGELATTIPEFADSCRFPLGALMMDLDYYSSTRTALRLLDVAPSLPRVPIYFDDLWQTTPFTGEWAAIEEYNAGHGGQKIAQTWEAAHAADWLVRVFEWHNFEDPAYSRRLTSLDLNGQLPLQAAEAPAMRTAPSWPRTPSPRWAGRVPDPR